MLAQFKELGIGKQIDYDKFCFYSIIVNSSFIDGSTLTDIEVQLLFEEFMNQLQFELGIIPTNINKDRKAEYIEALIATCENDDIELFRNFILDEHIYNLEKTIHNYQASMKCNGIKIT